MYVVTLKPPSQIGERGTNLSILFEMK